MDYFRHLYTQMYTTYCPAAGTECTNKRNWLFFSTDYICISQRTLCKYTLHMQHPELTRYLHMYIYILTQVRSSIVRTRSVRNKVARCRYCLTFPFSRRLEGDRLINTLFVRRRDRCQAQTYITTASNPGKDVSIKQTAGETVSAAKSDVIQVIQLMDTNTTQCVLQRLLASGDDNAKEMANAVLHRCRVHPHQPKPDNNPG